MIKCKNAYDWDKIRNIIEEELNNGLETATLGMAYDWKYTADTIWTVKDGYDYNICDPRGDQNRHIIGLDGSYTDYPFLSLKYEGEEFIKGIWAYKKE